MDTGFCDLDIILVFMLTFSVFTFLALLRDSDDSQDSEDSEDPDPNKQTFVLHV